MKPINQSARATVSTQRAMVGKVKYFELKMVKSYSVALKQTFSIIIARVEPAA